MRRLDAPLGIWKEGAGLEILKVKRGRRPQYPPLYCLAVWVWVLGSRLSYPTSIRAYDGPLKVALQQHAYYCTRVKSLPVHSVAVIAAMSDQQDGVLAWLPFLHAADGQQAAMYQTLL